MKPELLKILERVRLSRAVTGAGSGPVTQKPAPCLAVTGVTAVTAENRQGENLHRRQEVEQARLLSIESDSFPVGTPPPVATLRAAALTRPSTFPAVTPVTPVTPHSSAASSVTAAGPGAVTGRDKPEPAPRFRAWRARFADGRTMTVLNPAGMDHAEALAAVDRWPGCTVEPLPASRVES